MALPQPPTYFLGQAGTCHRPDASPGCTPASGSEDTASSKPRREQLVSVNAFAGLLLGWVGPPTPPPTPIRPLSGHLGRLPKGNGSELTNLAATWAHAQSTCGAEGLADLKIQTPKQAFQTTWLPPTLGPRCKLEPGTRCPRPPRRSPGKGGPRAGSLATALAAARPHLCRSRAKPSPHGLRFWLGGLSKNCANTRPHTWC